MSLTQELQEVVETEKRRFESQPEYARLARFLEDMKARDLVRPEEYGLPLIDTIGSSVPGARDPGSRS